MSKQLNIFDQMVHLRENNPQSEENLASNYEKFSGQCKRVFEMLMNGYRLTTETALVNHRIFSLPRRLLDLKKAGVRITDEWRKDEGFKIWFMTEGDREMNRKLKISFDVTHRFENNRESQTILDKRRDDFIGNCWEILKRLLKGEKLTVMQMMVAGVTCHLPRRILDLKEHGIIIHDRWVEMNGKVHHHKEWWMDFNEKERVMERLVTGLRFEKKKSA